LELIFSSWGETIKHPRARRFQHASQTLEFSNTAQLTSAPGLLSYEVNSPLWSDGAIKQRWAAIPPMARSISAREAPGSSGRSVFVNILILELTRAIPKSSSTLKPGPDRWKQRTSLWRDLQVAARSNGCRLISRRRKRRYCHLDRNGCQDQKWIFPGRQDCLRCHTAAGGYVLGVNSRQLNGDHLSRKPELATIKSGPGITQVCSI